MDNHFFERTGVRGTTLYVEGVFDCGAAAAALNWLRSSDRNDTIDLSGCTVIDHVCLRAFVCAAADVRPRVLGVNRLF